MIKEKIVLALCEYTYTLISILAKKLSSWIVTNLPQTRVRSVCVSPKTTGFSSEDSWVSLYSDILSNTSVFLIYADNWFEIAKLKSDAFGFSANLGWKKVLNIWSAHNANVENLIYPLEDSTLSFSCWAGKKNIFPATEILAMSFN